jgi:hypothetical protein
MSDENNFPLPHVPKFPGALFDEFGQRADERVHVYAMVHAAAAQAAERDKYQCLRALLAGADILAQHSGAGDTREWHTAQCWLQPGEVLAHMDAPPDPPNI